jgi:isovaleryl-CoA dehydrogenase
VSDAPIFEVLEEIITTIVDRDAVRVDIDGSFPREAIDTLGAAGLLGLISAPEVGGGGGGFDEASGVVRRLARSCASTAMIVAMHYSATAVIEANGPEDVRRDIAAGRHLSTLAFSETGSRSHFWAPLGTATAHVDRITLDASKSWVTSAGEAQSYVWTSKPFAAESGATLWLVPAESLGLSIAGSFNGLGLRGNASSPVSAVGGDRPSTPNFGTDGGGLDIALSVALPWFQILNASASLGVMDAMITKTIEHASTARLEHLGQSLADQPVVRQHLAEMQIAADAASTLVDDAKVALSTGRGDGALRMLETKALAGDTALSVADLAMRVGGGAAFRKELGLERHFRDARAAAVMAPTSDALRDFIGRALCGMPLFG